MKLLRHTVVTGLTCAACLIVSPVFFVSSAIADDEATTVIRNELHEATVDCTRRDGLLDLYHVGSRQRIGRVRAPWVHMGKGAECGGRIGNVNSVDQEFADWAANAWSESAPRPRVYRVSLQIVAARNSGDGLTYCAVAHEKGVSGGYWYLLGCGISE